MAHQDFEIKDSRLMSLLYKAFILVVCMGCFCRIAYLQSTDVEITGNKLPYKDIWPYPTQIRLINRYMLVWPLLTNIFVLVFLRVKVDNG